MNYKFWIFCALLIGFQMNAQKNYIENLLVEKDSFFKPLFENPEKYRIQILYTKITRDQQNKPHFKTYSYRANSKEYFYPASTVKLAACILALEKINRLKEKGIDKNTPLIHLKNRDSQIAQLKDSTSQNGLPSVAQYIKKILLVSDNDAFNRLFEFIGQEEFNKQMKQKGFKDVRIIHRLQMPLPPIENRYSNPFQFIGEDGKVIYEEAEKFNEHPIYSISPIFLGKGVMQDDGKIEYKPLEFTFKNSFPLKAQHELLKRLMFPESVKPSKRFELNKEDYEFLYKYMSMSPLESDYPNYKSDSTIHDNYCKFLYYGGDKNTPQNPNIKIYNKVGDAYGFLLDNAYFIDKKNKIEFLLTATILCNEDEIFNDDKYDYEKVGFPFFKKIAILGN